MMAGLTEDEKKRLAQIADRVRTTREVRLCREWNKIPGQYRPAPAAIAQQGLNGKEEKWCSLVGVRQRPGYF
jgi:hypothetical protein